MDYDEILDIVSPLDEVIGQEKRSIVYSRKLHFRVINAFVCNAQKQLWIPRRHPNKKLFPLSLDCSVGGHVSAGEDYDQAFVRETAEELNLNVATIQFRKIARLMPMTHGTSAFMWVYIIYSDVAPAFNTNDFIEYYWFTPEEIIHRLRSGDTAKSDLLPILQAIKDIL